MSSSVAAGELFPSVRKGVGFGFSCGPTSFNSLMEISSHLSEAKVVSGDGGGVVEGILLETKVDSGFDAELEFAVGGGVAPKGSLRL